MLIGFVGERLGAASIVPDRSAGETFAVSEKLGGLTDGADCRARGERADLRTGSHTVLLDRCAVAQFVDCHPDQINPDGLTIEAPFRIRRRGAELRLHITEALPMIDQTPIQNIPKTPALVGDNRGDQVFSEISGSEGTSKRRGRMSSIWRCWRRTFSTPS